MGLFIKDVINKGRGVLPKDYFTDRSDGGGEVKNHKK